MGWRESAVEEYFETLRWHTRWMLSPGKTVFLLAWRSKTVRVFRVDLSLRGSIPGTPKVREGFLEMLRSLRQGPDWEGVFKGREVEFGWLSWRDPGERGLSSLRGAGVEPCSLLSLFRSWPE